MRNFLFVICCLSLVSWYVHFDPDAYHERRMNKQIKKEKEIHSKSKLIFPLKHKSLEDVVSGYGDSRDNGARIHEGIDIPAEKGTPILAVADGEITRIANKNNAGKQVWLKVGTQHFFYAHLDSWLVEEGQFVKQGDIIGTVGNTGNAKHTIPHLHFGVYVSRGKTADPVGLF